MIKFSVEIEFMVEAQCCHLRKYYTLRFPVCGVCTHFGSLIKVINEIGNSLVYVFENVKLGSWLDEERIFGGVLLHN